VHPRKNPGYACASDICHHADTDKYFSKGITQKILGDYSRGTKP